MIQLNNFYVKKYTRGNAFVKKFLLFYCINSIIIMTIYV